MEIRVISIITEENIKELPIELICVGELDFDKSDFIINTTTCKISNWDEDIYKIIFTCEHQTREEQFPELYAWLKYYKGQEV